MCPLSSTVFQITFKLFWLFLTVLTSEVHDLRIVLQSADKELSHVKLEYSAFREKQEKEISQLSARHMDVQFQLDSVRYVGSLVQSLSSLLDASSDLVILSCPWTYTSHVFFKVVVLCLSFACLLVCLWAGVFGCLGCLIGVFLLCSFMPISGNMVELLERKQNVPALILLSYIIFSLNRIYLKLAALQKLSGQFVSLVTWSKWHNDAALKNYKQKEITKNNWSLSIKARIAHCLVCNNCHYHQEMIISMLFNY